MYSDHELASLFPVLPPAGMRQLVDSIKEHGLQHPIMLYEGKILDGRHRYAACNTAEVKPHFTTYNGKDPLGFVLSANLHRRHLDTSQRAMIAAKLATMKHGGDRRSEAAKQVANVPLNRTTAAETLGVSPRLVTTARKVLDESPKLAKQVAAGNISLHAAEQQIDATKEKPAGVVKDKSGYPVPERAMALWNRSDEVMQWLQLLGKLKGVLTTAQKDDDVLWRSVNFSSTIAELQNVGTGIKEALPYAVCTSCQGQISKNCTLCKGRGFLSKFSYEHCIAEEVRNFRKKACQ